MVALPEQTIPTKLEEPSALADNVLRCSISIVLGARVPCGRGSVKPVGKSKLQSRFPFNQIAQVEATTPIAKAVGLWKGTFPLPPVDRILRHVVATGNIVDLQVYLGVHFLVLCLVVER